MAKYRPRSEVHSKAESKPTAQAKPQALANVRAEPASFAESKSGASIRFESVTKRFASGFQALTELSFELAADEMVFVTGHSGAGKSTLLRMIAAIDRPTKGTVYALGQPVSRFAPSSVPAYRRELGLVFQDHRLLFDRSVYENVALPLVVAGVAHRDIGKRVRAALDKVNLGSKERALPITLSGGEQQRVGIARAAVAKPKIILADEPTGNLDPELSEEIMQLFVEFNRAGTTVLVASHDLHLVRKLEKRVLVLDHGKLIDDFRPAQRRQNPLTKNVDQAEPEADEHD
jgi:cell division transport system ATP-binding protein